MHTTTRSAIRPNQKRACFPVLISEAQSRSLSRHLSNAGIHCSIFTGDHGGPVISGATAAQVIAAAHEIPSLRGLRWMNIAKAEIPQVSAPAFASQLLLWERGA